MSPASMAARIERLPISSFHRRFVSLIALGGWFAAGQHNPADHRAPTAMSKRLKLAGAWWTPNHVAAMLALPISRANREWEAYWQWLAKQAA